jgi:predicted unusual protein kinase regulating ubiquinone biosynthesis (AarF/ABC1/UbiB family)
MSEGQLGPLLTQLTTIALRHDVRMPASLALAGKALAQMQLAAGELDPQLDPFSVAGSFFSRMVLSQLRGSVSPGRMLYEASKVRSRLQRMFLSIEGLMSGARDGRLKVQFRGTERLEDTIGRVGRRLVLSLVTTASMVSTAMVATSTRAPGWVAVVDGGIGSVFAGALIWDLLRRR